MTKVSPGVLFLPAPAGLRGTVQVPGDKSVSHRAILLGAVSSGVSVVSGLLRSADTAATLAAVRALGVKVEEHDDSLVIHGSGWEGLTEPEDVIDVGNAGTLIRLLPGLLASLDFFCVLTGDASIRRRPMARVLEPLSAMGAAVTGRRGGTLAPIAIRGGPLKGISYRLPVASAQVKSCLLLAGLRASGETAVYEPAASRDHTERLIQYAGGWVQRDGLTDGPGVVRIRAVEQLRLDRLAIPGDFSSAAFFIVAALLVPGSELLLTNVGLNPTRTGLLRVLERMGADIDVAQDSPAGPEPVGPEPVGPEPVGPEPVGRLIVRTSDLTATTVDEAEVPAMIDELPLFLLAAAKAKGTSRLHGAAELRAKESDRLRAMGTLLRSLGVQVVEYPDGMEVTGNPLGWRGGHVSSGSDHRLAMVGAVAGAASREGVVVDDLACTQVSYPGFADVLARLGGPYEVLGHDEATAEVTR